VARSLGSRVLGSGARRATLVATHKRGGDLDVGPPYYGSLPIVAASVPETRPVRRLKALQSAVDGSDASYYSLLHHSLLLFRRADDSRKPNMRFISSFIHLCSSASHAPPSMPQLLEVGLVLEDPSPGGDCSSAHYQASLSSLGSVSLRSYGLSAVHSVNTTVCFVIPLCPLTANASVTASKAREATCADVVNLVAEGRAPPLQLFRCSVAASWQNPFAGALLILSTSVSGSLICWQPAFWALCINFSGLLPYAYVWIFFVIQSIN
jgi:hypothetical protein